MNEDTHTPSTEDTRQTVSIRSLLSDTVIYGLGDVADRAAGFLLLPIITLLLDPADYGICGLFGTASYILFLFFSMGSSTFVPSGESEKRLNDSPTE